MPKIKLKVKQMAGSGNENLAQRCSACNKRLKLMDFACSCCQKKFCILHRLPEDHLCSADYKTRAIDENKAKVMSGYLSETHNYVKL